jgi:hypothetical protein
VHAMPLALLFILTAVSIAAALAAVAFALART